MKHVLRGVIAVAAVVLASFVIGVVLAGLILLGIVLAVGFWLVSRLWRLSRISGGNDVSHQR